MFVRMSWGVFVVARQAAIFQAKIKNAPLFGSWKQLLINHHSYISISTNLLAAMRHTVIRAPGPFNFSRLNNLARAKTAGDHLVFWNDDTEARSPDWLQALEEHAQRAEVGAVGAKLLYP